MVAWNKMISGIRGFLFVLLTALAVLPDISEAVRLRQIGQIDLGDDDEIYGLTTNNITIKSPDKLTFLSRRFEVRNEVPFDSSQTVVVSASGLYYAFIEKTENDPDDSASYIAAVYDSRNRPRWGTFGLPEGVYFLSPNGEYLVVITGTPRWNNRKLFIYHKSRPIVENDICFFEDLLFSDDGNYLLIDAGPEGARLFDDAGSFIADYGSQQSYAFSEDSRLLASFFQGHVKIFEGEREILALNPKELLLNGIEVRNEADRLFLAFHNQLLVYDTHSGEKILARYTGKEGGTFASLDVSPDNRFVACGVDINRGTLFRGHERHVTGYLYLMDIEGRSLETMEFNYDKYRPGLPQVTFAPDNRIIFVQNRPSLHIIEMY